jgi:DNA repair protein RecO (recombination protein O)
MASGNVTPAFCLHVRPYRESSLLVQLFTEQAGRTTVIVKGAKSSVKKRGTVLPLLQPFIPLLVSMTGKSDLKILKSVEPGGIAFALKDKAIFAGLYLNELLLRLLPEHIEYPGIYSCYQQALQVMQNDAGMEIALRQFELGLLEGLGYGVPFVEVNEAGGQVGSLQAGVDYRFVEDSGFVRCERDRAVAGSFFVFGGEQLLKMAMADWTDVETIWQAKHLMRMVLARLLGDKPLNSKQLFR